MLNSQLTICGTPPPAGRCCGSPTLPFCFQFVPIPLDVVVLHHDDYHIHLVDELVEVENLVLDNLLTSEGGVEGL